MKMTSMTLADFFVLDHPSDHESWWLQLSQRVMMPDNWMEFMDGTYEGPNPVLLKIMRGRKRPKVIGSATRLRLVSGEFRSILHACRASGVVTHPTIVYDRNDEQVIDRECLWLKLQVGCGPVDMRSGKFLMQFGGGSKDADHLPIGLHFDPTTWTGLDVFRAANWPAIIVTKRVADAIVASGRGGLEIESAATYGDRTRKSMIRTFGDPATE
jgi:hypothetical protein